MCTKESEAKQKAKEGGFVSLPARIGIAVFTFIIVKHFEWRRVLIDFLTGNLVVIYEVVTQYTNQ